MTERFPSVTRFIVGGATWEATATPGDSAQQVHVALTRDGRLVWRSQQPSWGGLSFGSAGTAAYVWTARTLVVFAPMSIDEPEIVDVEEDLKFVFMRGDGWLLVCETSVRLWSKGVERSRLEFGEVVDLAALDADDVLITDISGRSLRVRVDGGTLEV